MVGNVAHKKSPTRRIHDVHSFANVRLASSPHFIGRDDDFDENLGLAVSLLFTTVSLSLLGAIITK
jgi:hypothetical protein